MRQDGFARADAVGRVGACVEVCERSSGLFFFLQAEDRIRDLVRSRGLGDVYKRQEEVQVLKQKQRRGIPHPERRHFAHGLNHVPVSYTHLTLPTNYPV